MYRPRNNGRKAKRERLIISEKVLCKKDCTLLSLFLSKHRPTTPIANFPEIYLVHKVIPILQLQLVTKRILIVFDFLCFVVSVSEIPLGVHTGLVIDAVRVFSCVEYLDFERVFKRMKECLANRRHV